jgi:hypothetical protein
MNEIVVRIAPVTASKSTPGTFFATFDFLFEPLFGQRFAAPGKSLDGEITWVEEGTS